MGIGDWLGIGKAVSEPIKAVEGLYTTDKARLVAESQLEEVLQKPQLAQLDINKILASSSNVFTNGWIPMAGWSVGFLILMYYFPQITIMTYVWGKKCIITGNVHPYPMKPDDLMNLVGLLFGFKAHNLLSNIIKR